MSTIDKAQFIKDLRDIKNNCINQLDYDPAKDLAYLITKHNLDERILWKAIKSIVYRQVP